MNKEYIKEWISLMERKRGHKILDRETHKVITWQEGIYKLLFGDYKTDLSTTPIKISEGEIEVTDEVILQLEAWRKGRWPLWAKSGELQTLHGDYHFHTMTPRRVGPDTTTYTPREETI